MFFFSLKNSQFNLRAVSVDVKLGIVSSFVKTFTFRSCLLSKFVHVKEINNEDGMLWKGIFTTLRINYVCEWK